MDVKRTKKRGYRRRRQVKTWARRRVYGNLSWTLGELLYAPWLGGTLQTTP